ncbi:MAG TPA: NUDIX hydrolase, partial [Ktedonobacterales bacterium]|nr:NUDIX hydrolase [Ktedonobacterales bacterium]
EMAQGRFNYRVAGVCIEDGHILLQTFANSLYWILPGGRPELSESSDVALKREMREELAVDVQLERLLWVVESFFLRSTGRPFHEIAMYYLMALPAESTLHDKTQTVTGKDGESIFTLKWFPLPELADMLLFPPFLRTRLTQLPLTVEHLIEEER